MRDVDKIIGRLAIIVPVLHLTSCGLFMAGYSAGFGGGVGGLFSPSDFFTITIQYLILIYALSLGVPTLLTVARHRLGWASYQDIIEKETDQIRKEKLRSNGEFTKVVLVVSIWISLALFGLIFALSIWVGAIRDHYVMFMFFAVSLAPLWWKVSNHFDIPMLPSELALNAVLFVVAVIGIGMDRGDRDRRLPFELVVSKTMQCNDHRILRPIGERFISVTPDNRRYIINDECETQFVFETVPIYSPKPLGDLVVEKFNESP